MDERALAVILMVRRAPVLHRSDHVGAAPRVEQQSAVVPPVV